VNQKLALLPAMEDIPTIIKRLWGYLFDYHSKDQLTHFKKALPLF